MAGKKNYIVVRVLGNTRGLSKSMKSASRQVRRVTGDFSKLTGSLGTLSLGALTTAAAIGGVGAAAAGLAAIGGAVTVGFVGVMIGGLAAIAASSDRVKSAWAGMRGEVMDKLRGATAPLVPVLVRGADAVRGAVDAVLPAVERLSRKIAPVLDDLFKGLPGGATVLTDMLESTFDAMLPVFEAFIGSLDDITRGIGGFFKNFGGAKGSARFMTDLGDALERLLPSLGELLGAVAPLGSAFLDLLVPAIDGAVKWIAEELVPAMTDLLGWMNDNRDVIGKLVLAFSGLFIVSKLTGLLTALGGIVGALLTPTGLVVGALVLLGYGFYKAWKKSETFRNIVTGAFHTVKRIVTGVVDEVRRVSGNVMADIRDWWKRDGDQIKAQVLEAWRKIKRAIVPVIEEIADTIKDKLRKIDRWWSEHGDSILRNTTEVFPLILDIVVGTVEAIAFAVKGTMQAAKGDWSGAWNSMKSAAKSAARSSGATTKAMWKLMRAEWTDGAGDLEHRASKAAQRVTSRFDRMAAGAGRATGRMSRDVKRGADGAARNLSNAAERGRRNFQRDLDKLPGIAKRNANAAERNARTNLYPVGANAARGMAQGITDNAWRVRVAAAQLAAAADNMARHRLEIHSPSRLFRRMGEHVSEGLALGIKAKAGKAKDSAAGLARTVAEGFSAPKLTLDARPALAGAPGGRGGVGNTYQITVQAPVGASGADIGRTLVKHIEEFERAGGRKRK